MTGVYEQEHVYDSELAEDVRVQDNIFASKQQTWTKRKGLTRMPQGSFAMS